jgi:hypothetical protein
MATSKKAGKGSPKAHRFGGKQKHGKSRERYFAKRALLRQIGKA